MSLVAFAGSNIDRADHVRADPGAIEKLMTVNARLLRLNGLDPVIEDDGTLGWTSLAEADADAELLFIGMQGDRGHFAQVPGMKPREALAMGRSWQAMSALSASDLATYGGARSLVSWHIRHRFCACCGSPTQVAKGGWQRDCISENCAMQHFPRVDPVTIMLVEHEGQVLLGRQPQFPAGNYSALAGFVEPGETLEEAVARETQEEAGVKVRDVSYVVSQPWPFPSSLMIGCHSYADDAAITIDRTELDDARWFTREAVADAVAASDRGEAGSVFQCPPRFAVANYMLRWWLDRGE